MTTDDQMNKSLGELNRAVTKLESTMAAIEKRLHLMYTVVLLVVGAVGGPNAIQALTK
ncbi:MAG: hypothetical protein HOV73_01810 [Streptomyces sp.]|nr:hypothetical protein [Streptomyces sp.]